MSVIPNFWPTMSINYFTLFLSIDQFKLMLQNFPFKFSLNSRLIYSLSRSIFVSLHFIFTRVAYQERYIGINKRHRFTRQSQKLSVGTGGGEGGGRLCFLDRSVDIIRSTEVYSWCSCNSAKRESRFVSSIFNSGAVMRKGGKKHHEAR